MYQTIAVVLGLVASVLFFSPETIIKKLPKDNEHVKNLAKHHQNVAFFLALVAIYLYVNYPDTLSLEVPSVPSIKTPSRSSRSRRSTTSSIDLSAL